jgi:hypothetical protein
MMNYMYKTTVFYKYWSFPVSPEDGGFENV